MKKTYLKPIMMVVKIQQRSKLLVGSPFDSMDGKQMNRYDNEIDENSIF